MSERRRRGSRLFRTGVRVVLALVLVFDVLEPAWLVVHEDRTWIVEAWWWSPPEAADSMTVSVAWGTTIAQVAGVAIVWLLFEWLDRKDERQFAPVDTPENT